MNRIVSFGLLLAVILITGFVFFKVMAGFFLPLFLAALLVVLFRPLHEWILKRVKGRPGIGALLTTSTILLIVLLPFLTIVVLAANEGRTVIRKLNPLSVDDKIREVRAKFGLDLPAFAAFEKIDRVIEAIHEQSVAKDIQQQREQIEYDITELRGLSVDLGTSLAQEEFVLQWDESPDDTENEPNASTANPDSPNQQAWHAYAIRLAVTRRMLSETAWKELQDIDTQQEQIQAARKQFDAAIDDYYSFKSRLLGGPVQSWLKEIANPNSEELGDYIQKVTRWLRQKMVSIGSATTAFLGRFLFGVIIMSIALFSFLLDGPAMLKAIKQLTPLDDDYEDELIAEFEVVSRAVVMATLLSAVAQGLLAAIGFYFAGFHSVVMLMLLTSVLALVPFVGAAAVWVPACLWLMFVDGRVWPGVFLSIYGTVIVSGADNIIKPFILHGQSNLHPLWALLSVLGGVTALGPVGILVGPMIVVFLQTLLKILQREIASIDRSASGSTASLRPGSILHATSQSDDNGGQ